MGEFVHRALWGRISTKSVHELMEGIEPSRKGRQFVVLAEVKEDDGAFLAGGRLVQVPRIAFAIEALREDDISVGNASRSERRIDP